MILPFAFLTSTMISFVVLSSENYKVLVILEACPQAYLHFVSNAVLIGILPIAASIALLTIALKRENLSMRFRNWLLIIIGGLCFLWGALYIRSSYFYYYDAVDLAHNWPLETVDSHIFSIYVAYGLVGVLWAIVGILLSIVYPLKTRYRSFVDNFKPQVLVI